MDVFVTTDAIATSFRYRILPVPRRTRKKRGRIYFAGIPQARRVSLERQPHPQIKPAGFYAKPQPTCRGLKGVNPSAVEAPAAPQRPPGLCEAEPSMRTDV